jgi:hypothetical protein
MNATSSDPQRIRVLFTLVGAAAGALVSMLWFSDNTDGKTDITISLGLALTGVALGSGIGELALWKCQSPGALRWIVILGILSLTGTLGAMMGWLISAILANNGFEHRRFTLRGVLIGGCVGLLTGFVIQALQFGWPAAKLKSPPSS